MNASSGSLSPSDSTVAAIVEPGVSRGCDAALKADVAVHDIRAQPPTAPGGPERRSSGRRGRASDRLLDRATRDYADNAAFGRVRDVETMMLFVDDDLRETALALGRIETYLVRTLQTLESPDIRRADVMTLAGDTSVLDHLDALNETVESLRGRLARLASRMR